MMKPNDQYLKLNRADDRALKPIDYNIHTIQRTDEHLNRCVKKRKTEIGESHSVRRSHDEYGKENNFEPLSKHSKLDSDLPLKAEISENNDGNLASMATHTEVSTQRSTSSSLLKTKTGHVNKRKNNCPTRSAARQDPNFRGVTFLLHTQLQGCDSHLVISAYFSNVNMKPVGSHSQVRNRHNSCGSVTSYHTDCWSGSDEDSQPVYHKNPYISVKTCASCGTRRTPLWRDAEDGTPLCNACGIRFKKYKVRCSQCWHIPKKDIKTFPNCPNCGALLRVSVCRRSW
ncbi:uncharacterized protein [Argopecten irradians]|uniref:uncharacterized protein n=1 Tax=Argopecten irradians TaxID=31199 RepID=UPI003719AF25